MNSWPFARLILRLAFYSLPLVATAGWLEWRLCSLPTRFTYKHSVLVDKGPYANVLVLGSSHANAGLDPAQFPCPGINLANDSQTLDVDSAMLAKVGSRARHLQVVIQPVSFLSFRARLRDNKPMHWRLGLYRRIFGLDLDDSGSPSQRLQDSCIARATPRGALTLAIRRFPAPENDCTELGWTPDPVQPGMTGLEEARRRARLHQAGSGGPNDQELIRDFQNILALTKGLGATAVVLVPPFHANYVHAWPPEDVALFHRTVAKLTTDGGAIFADYSQDPRFGDQDFADADHLSPEGARRFSRMVAAEVLAPILRCDEAAGGVAPR